MYIDCIDIKTKKQVATYMIVEKSDYSSDLTNGVFCIVDILNNRLVDKFFNSWMDAFADLIYTTIYDISIIFKSEKDLYNFSKLTNSNLLGSAKSSIKIPPHSIAIVGRLNKNYTPIIFEEESRVTTTKSETILTSTIKSNNYHVIILKNIL